MKIASVLLAVYVVALSVLPCNDGYVCNDEATNATEINSENHSSEEEDMCSPFCVCACCATHIQLTHTSEITFSNLIHNTEVVTFYFEHSLPNKSSSIWQPPRIA